LLPNEGIEFTGVRCGFNPPGVNDESLSFIVNGNSSWKTDLSFSLTGFARMQERLSFKSLIHQEERMASFDKELDARGLNCPLPILRTKKVLAELGAGQTLKIIATDPGSVKDFQAFAKQTGNELLESSEASGEYTFFIKKK